MPRRMLGIEPWDRMGLSRGKKSDPIKNPFYVVARWSPFLSRIFLKENLDVEHKFDDKKNEKRQ